MNTIEQKDSAEEIVIVAGCYEGLSDVIKPLCDKGEPIEREEFVKLIGGEEVILSPRDNYYDRYAVGVYTANQRLLGYVWMNQAPSVRQWMEAGNKKYVVTRINRINTQTGLIMAELPKGMSLDRVFRSAGIDTQWAADLPFVVKSISQQGLELGLYLLKDKLESLTEWDEDIKTKIDNVMLYLESDLSDNCYGECNDVYKLMRKSPVLEIKEQADWFVKKLANRGSRDRKKWWIEKWLPKYMEEACEGNLMSIYKEGDYTLEKVEELLKSAPFDLFKLYKADKKLFVNKLYYSVLPKEMFYNLLTLLTVWEKLRNENKTSYENQNQNENYKERVIDNKVLKKAVGKVKPFMWAASSYAVLYCVCRDKYGIPDNMSQFEREFSNSKTGYTCKEGVISSTFRTNSYMKLHIDRWEQNGAKERALILKNKFIEEVNNIIQE